MAKPSREAINSFLTFKEPVHLINQNILRSVLRDHQALNVTLKFQNQKRENLSLIINSKRALPFS